MTAEEYKNHGTRELCRKLLKSGIILDTEHYWFCSCPPHCDEYWYIEKKDNCYGYKEYPSPTISELLEILPKDKREEYCNMNVDELIIYTISSLSSMK